MTATTIEKTEPATAPCARFRRNAKNEWVVFGPSTLVVEGPVTVTQKNGGSSDVTVVGVGKGFLVDGVEHRYGYLTAPAAPQPTAPAREPVANTDPADFMPDDFDPGEDADPGYWE